MANGETNDTLEPTRRRWDWTSFNPRTVIALAVVVGLMAFLLTRSDGPGSEQTVTPNEGASTITVPYEPAATDTSDDVADAPRTTSAASASSFAAGRGYYGSATMPAALLSLGSEITNMGPTELGIVSSFPPAAYSWDRFEFAVGVPSDVSWLGEVDGRLVAVTAGWDASSNSQMILSYVSEDGLDWEEGSVQRLPAESSVGTIVGDGSHVFVFVESWGDTPVEHYLYTSGDGVSWVVDGLALGDEDTDYAYVQRAAAGPAGIAIAAVFESYPDEPPAVLDFGDVNVELRYLGATFRVLDTVSGEELMVGTIGDILHWDSEGQIIFDPATGEEIVTIPTSVWEDAVGRSYNRYGMGTPLPLPGVSSEPVYEPISIEYGGYIVEIDEMAGTYRVVDAESGNESIAGTLELLYQGPPPRIVDPDTGRVYVEVTWDEWYRVEAQAMSSVGTGVGYANSTELLTSVDGTIWDATVVSDTAGGSVTALAPTSDGFVALVQEYEDFGGRSLVWTMRNGAWSSVPRDGSDLWLSDIVRADGDFVAVGEGDIGSSLWSSSDGTSWTSEFTIATQSDGSYVYLADLTADTAGNLAVLLQREMWDESLPLVIEKDGYTLTFGEGAAALVVTTATGETVFTMGWDAEGSDAVSWADSATRVALDNGDVVTITDEEAYAAIEAGWAESSRLGVSVFLRQSGDWSEAIVEAEGAVRGVGQVYQFNGKIFIAGSVYDGDLADYASGDGITSGSFVVIVGTPR